MESATAQNSAFWEALETLAANATLVLDRPKESAHPRYPDFVYPVDYGFLSGTASMDGGGIDVWLGSDEKKRLDAVMCIVDLSKRDSEIKLLIGCTAQEKELVFQIHNKTQYMKGILIRRS